MSREKQIDDIRKIIANCDGVPGNVCRFKPCSLCKAERLYNAGYRKQSEAEWISVDERLPDCEQGAESEAVLFITKQGFMYTGYYGCGGIYHDRYFREYKNSTEGYDISSVTHWMPLPEPPGMKGGAE